MPLIRCNRTSIGKKVLDGSETQIATSIFDHDAETLENAFRSGRRKPDLLYEIRFDLFNKKDGGELSAILDFLNSSDVDYIFTFRSTNGDDLRNFYSIAADNHVPAADIEISQFGKLPSDVKFNTLILSHHSYTGEKVQDSCKEIISQNPGVVKLASSYGKFEDFQEDFIELQKVKRETGKCMSFIPMGAGNSFLRVLSAYVLSDLVYAKEDTQTAEGQLTRTDYESFFKVF